MSQNLTQPSAADVLNQGCHCSTLNPDSLRLQLERDPSLNGLAESLTATRPHLFSSTVVFLSSAMHQRMADTVAAIERVIALPAYQAMALARAPAIAQKPVACLGVCMGYDFHLGADGPQLIEINTNAGGALLNAALAHAQQACCEAMDWAFPLKKTSRADLDQTFIDMFLAEWRLQRGDAALRHIVIVDDAPQAQYLAPEFFLFKQLFEQHGLLASIADPADLMWREGKLWHLGQAVDMVYNRLTDFYLDEPGHQTLRAAFEADAVVLTPHPRAHAVHADKRNLATLSNDALLEGWGVSQADRDLLLAGVPRTRSVSADQADALWAARKSLFFKPVAGYAGKAAYRGDKLTRGVWADILAGDFVAQDLVPPKQRVTRVAGDLKDLKFDLRAYAYNGQVQLLAARMYAGQTTNFRTPGGGFAPVMVLDKDPS
ncbi:MAG: hypothetical protein EOP38_17400 [Rubrivivax sp.]|nr:MAG: hypothetical protein EOP38_17400 [Rubrivivax sp.]